MHERQADLYEAFARTLDPDTSHDAAEAISRELGRMEELVYQSVLKAGKDGLTCEEVTAQLEIDQITVSPRFKQLELKGRLYRTSLKRKNRTGRSAYVWFACPR